MTISQEDVKAEAYHEYSGTYYIKVSFLGMYISGITVRNSPNYDGWMVTMPSYKSAGGKWKKYIEFSGDSELKSIIHNKCIGVVEQEVSLSNENDAYMPTNYELENPEEGLDEAIKSLGL